jgi:membrane associated rhomboid family serine protease
VIPLKDDVPAERIPALAVAIIAANVLVHLYQLSLRAEGGGAAHELVTDFGLVPCRLTGYCAASGAAPPVAVALVASMFLHGGLFHLGGNMLYLWIFGRTIESTLGHARFAAIYALGGVVAALAQAAADPASAVPMIGASGAISAILGAYLLLHPRAGIHTLVIFGIFVRVMRVPAIVVLGLWIVVQLANVILTVGVQPSLGGVARGGVAWVAHVGGFLAGLAVLPLLRPRGHARRR